MNYSFISKSHRLWTLLLFLLLYFAYSEDLEDTVSLHHLFNIFNYLITLGNALILQVY